MEWFAHDDGRHMRGWRSMPDGHKRRGCAWRRRRQQVALVYGVMHGACRGNGAARGTIVVDEATCCVGRGIGSVCGTCKSHMATLVDGVVHGASENGRVVLIDGPR
jgi:hypothetical protein